MNNTNLRFLASIAVVVAVCSVWRAAVGDPQTPIKIGDGNLKLNGRPEIALAAKVDLLASRVEKLEAENAALKKEMLELEDGVQKNTGGLGTTKLLLGSLDKAVTKLDKDYKAHSHEIPFGFSNPATIVNSKANILIPWVSSGQMKSGSGFKTGTPVQK